jgi:hypothetical protein
MPVAAQPAAARREFLDAALLLLLALGLLLFFLQPVIDGRLAAGFPLDDGWIHATYARNLAVHGEFALNPGEASTGTTSLLWTLLFAAMLGTGMSPTAGAWLLGAAALMLLVVLWRRVLRLHGFGRLESNAAAAALPLSGIVLWWTLSGMETMLFLLLAVLALHAFTLRKYVLSGVWLALLLLARPEGILLAPVLAFAAWRSERSLRPPLTLLAVASSGLLIYFLWNLAVSGAMYTSTLAGRRWLAHGGSIPDTDILSYPIDLATLLFRWLRTVLWGMLRWAPPITWVAAAAAALLLAIRFILRFLPQHRGEAAKRGEAPKRGEAALLGAWALLHAAAYAALLPYPGHAGRYLAPLLLPATVLLAMMLRNEDSKARWSLRRALPAAVLGVAAVLVTVASIASWSTAWRSSVAHINDVHREAAEWIKGHTTPESRIACYDIGAMAYFSDRHIIDLGGLADPAAAAFMHGRIDEYILRSRAEVTVMIAPYEGLDARGYIPAALGYGASGMLNRHTVAEFHIPPWQYRRHIAVTGNAYPRILVQKIARKPEKS